MRYLFICFILINISCCLSARGNEFTFDRLDSLVNNRNYYIEKKKSQINSLKQLYYKSSNPNEKYNLGNEIFKLYSKFNKDSAIYYAKNNYIIAKATDDRNKMAASEMNYVFMMAASGMYKECFDLLPKFNPNEYSMEVKYQYYKLYEYVFQGLQTYSSDTYNKYYTFAIDSIYKEVLSCFDQTSIEYKEILIRKAYNNKDYNKTISLINQYLPNIKKETNEYAMILYMLANAFKEVKDEINYIKYITEVVEIDIKTAVKEYRALTELSEFLYLKGDIKRAYKYSRISLEDAELFNARQHTLEVARILPIINDAYQKQIKESQALFKNLSILLFGCIILLLISATFIFHQIKLLRKANYEKKHMIQKLSEVNHIKEEYIGHFMKLCSEYIFKLDDFRKLVNR